MHKVTKMKVFAPLTCGQFVYKTFAIFRTSLKLMLTI